MLYIKFIGSLLVIATSTTLGFLYADSFKKRLQQLNELQRCLHQLQNEILFTYTPLTEAFFSTSTKSKAPIKNIFEDAAEMLINNKVGSVYEAIKLAIEINDKNLNLNYEEKNILIDLSKVLGESDIDGQKSIFNLAIENVKVKIKQADELMRKNMKLYRYLGFTIGAMVVILIL